MVAGHVPRGTGKGEGLCRVGKAPHPGLLCLSLTDRMDKGSLAGRAVPRKLGPELLLCAQVLRQGWGSAGQQGWSHWRAWRMGPWGKRGDCLPPAVPWGLLGMGQASWLWGPGLMVPVKISKSP